MRLTSLFVFFASAGATLLLACGGGGSSGSNTNSSSTDPTTPAASSSSSSSGSACSAAGTAICERACGCSTDGKCYIATESDGGPSASLDFDNKQQCLNLYVLFGCTNGGESTMDYPACETAVSSASCVDAVGSTSKGVLFPKVCESKQ